MPAHRLTLEDGTSRDEWLLEWNASQFVLKDPDARCVLNADTAGAHRLVEIYELYAESKISFASPAGPLTFASQPEVVADVRAFVEAGLARDDEYRRSLKIQARGAVQRGLVMFLVGGSLFGLYCWWASWAPDPPPGHWLRWLGGLIHLVLLLALAVTLAGPYVCLLGWRQLKRINGIERAIANRDSRDGA
ncbi:MAG: hypothetical protein OES79_15655 [Planctomycetota bacterium]|nr:hypothetical protein [Planctomycetota bacterium]